MAFQLIKPLLTVLYFYFEASVVCQRPSTTVLVCSARPFIHEEVQI